VSQKRPTFTTCYNFYIHSSIAKIFGINVAEKVGNQNVLYFPTTTRKLRLFFATFRQVTAKRCAYALTDFVRQLAGLKCAARGSLKYMTQK